MPPRYVILLPVRDGGSYLRQAIDSIRGQTIESWRLLVLENHSRDATIETVRGYGDPRIALFSADRPLSIEQNWARSLSVLAEQGVGDDALLTFIGHDDLFAPDFLAQVAVLANRHPSATLYQMPFDLIDASGNLIRPCRPIPEREGAGDLLAALCWGIRDSFGTGYVFRAGDFRAASGFPLFPRLLYADHLLFARLAARGYKAAAVDVGCSYRLHRGSASNDMSSDRLNSHVAALHAFVEALDAEFDEMRDADRGRAALAALLARELFILETRAVRRLLDPVSQERTRVLADRLATLRAGPSTTPSGPFADLSPFAVRLRRLRLTLSLLRGGR